MVSVIHIEFGAQAKIPVPAIQSVDQWRASGQYARIRIRMSACCPVSGTDAIVPCRPVSL